MKASQEYGKRKEKNTVFSGDKYGKGGRENMEC